MCPSDTSVKTTVEIQKAKSHEDWNYIRDLCVRTGDSISESRAPFFAEFWVGPYQRLRPDHSYIARLEGKRVGYLVSAPDTLKFEIERRWKFYLPLIARVSANQFTWNDDVKRFVKRFFGFLPWIEESFSKSTHDEIARSYPAHLHMNVEAECRGAGVGRFLVERLSQDLQSLKISGIHLYCGEPPLKFYDRMGFRVLEKVEIKPGIVVYALGKSVSVPVSSGV